MKRLFLFTLLLIGTLNCVHAQKATIKGEIIDLEEPVKLYVAKMDGRTGLIIHEQEITTPLFKFQLDAPSDEITPCILHFRDNHVIE